MFDVLGEDLLRVIELSRTSGKIPGIFNSTFLALIPKTDRPLSFEDFRPISLCNFVYKIIGKIISIRIRKVLGRCISGEQFGFLPGRQIHDVVGVIQEGMHTMHVKSIKAVMIKIDLSKSYDRVSWTYLRVILAKLGFAGNFIAWVMSSLSSVSFSLLINGVATNFFKSGRGLRQGCPLAPLLFLIVVEGLGRAILHAKLCETYHGLPFGNDTVLTHVLFVDDIVMVNDGSEQSLSTLYEILMHFCKASGMQINDNKSSLYFSCMEDSEVITLQNIFSFPVDRIVKGMKYLGFHLKPCRYLIKDWDWLIIKVEQRIQNWSFRWLSKGGKLILIKAVLEAIPVYWMHFWVPMGVIDKIRKLCFNFLWAGKQNSSGVPWISWKLLALPKSLGGWGLKVPVLFAKALAAKNVWNIIHGSGLWVKIATQKYIYPMNILEWIRSNAKKKKNISICWKAVLWAFDLIGNSLVWKIGTGKDVHIGLDPWSGCKWRHALPVPMLDRLHMAGFQFISDIGIHCLSGLMTQKWLSADTIGFTDPLDIVAWNGYIATLKSSHVRLSAAADCLIWNLSKSGKYSPKEGYAELMNREVDSIWWWKVIWKMKCPLKTKNSVGFFSLVKH